MYDENGILIRLACARGYKMYNYIPPVSHV
jgi:hypothetical protein